MKGSKEQFEELREAELHKAEPFSEDFEFDDSRESYLLSLLDKTIYDEQKKKEYENKIKNGLTMAEYETMKSKFYADRINPVTQGGNYKQGDILKHLKQLK